MADLLALRRRIGCVMWMVMLLCGFDPRAEANGEIRANSMTFAGDRVASTVVDLPSRVSIAHDPFVSPTFEIHGTGRVTGLVLRSVLPVAQPNTVAVIRMSTSVCHWNTACDANNAIWVVGRINGRSISRTDRFDLPAGRYRAYLLADGAPVRVTVQAPQLSGSFVAMTDDVPSRTRDLDPHLGDLPQARVLGAYQRLARPGLLVWSLGNWTHLTVSQRTESCAVDHEQRKGDFLPGCGAPFTAGATSSAPNSVSSIRLDAAPGVWGLGGNMVDVGVSFRMFGVGLWMEYLPAPSPSGVISTLAPEKPAGAGGELRIASRATRLRRRRLVVRVHCLPRGIECSAAITARGVLTKRVRVASAVTDVSLRVGPRLVRRLRRADKPARLKICATTPIARHCRHVRVYAAR